VGRCIAAQAVPKRPGQTRVGAPLENTNPAAEVALPMRPGNGVIASVSVKK